MANDATIREVTVDGYTFDLHEKPWGQTVALCDVCRKGETPVLPLCRAHVINHEGDSAPFERMVNNYTANSALIHAAAMKAAAMWALETHPGQEAAHGED